MADLFAEERKPEYLFWVGSAGSYDDRAKKITRSFVRILEYAHVSYAVLGTEETDSGDAAKRAGNEFLFQMQAAQIIETLKMYEVKKIITCDPHDYNTLKNEYPDLGGEFEVFHHTEIIWNLIENGIVKMKDETVFSKKRFTYHDPCYLGRGNRIFEQPRNILLSVGQLVEMDRNKSKSLCCGAGGAQMFKEAEKGTKEVFELRTEDVLAVQPDIVAVACPFCMTMLTDGVKFKNKEEEIKVLDIAEIVSRALGLE